MSDLPPVGDPSTHFCFNTYIFGGALALLAASFIFLISSCFVKVSPPKCFKTQSSSIPSKVTPAKNEKKKTQANKKD